MSAAGNVRNDRPQQGGCVPGHGVCRSTRGAPFGAAAHARRARWPRRPPPQLRLGHFTARRPVLLCLVWLALLEHDPLGLFRLSLAASLWHECGHILCFWCLAGRWPRITVSVTGLSMRTRGEWLTPGGTALLALAGPAANFILAGVLAARLGVRATVRLDAFFAANVLIGAFSLLPVPPLDGGTALLALAEFWRQKLHFVPK